MREKDLPIYKIRNFKAEVQREPYFYLSTFEAHLQDHPFIQKPHKHDFYILLFITRGSGEHTIDFKKYPLGPNTVFVLTPGQVHSWELSADVQGYILFFSPEFYLQEFSQKKLQAYPFFNSLLAVPSLAVPEAGQPPVGQIFQLLEQEYLGQETRKETMLRRYLDVLLILLTRLYETQYPPQSQVPRQRPVVQKLQLLLDQHFREHQPIHFYAGQLHLSTRQLNDTCKQAFDKSPSELLQERILLEAQRLLVYADLSVTQIAAELGYFDSAYFFRFFKKHTGYTPEQFRNLHRQVPG